MCAAEHSTVSQACVRLVRDLHALPDSHWYDTVTHILVSRLNRLPAVVNQIKSDDANGIDGDEKTTGDETGRWQLLWHIWPAFAVISGVDEGLRMGSKCKMRNTAKCGVLLGVTHDGKLRVQWDDVTEATKSDCPIPSLQADNEPPFVMVDFPLLDASVFNAISELCAITNTAPSLSTTQSLRTSASATSATLAEEATDGNDETTGRYTSRHTYLSGVETMRKEDEWWTVSLSLVRSTAFATLRNIFTSSRYIELLMSSDKVEEKQHRDKDDVKLEITVSPPSISPRDNLDLKDGSENSSSEKEVCHT